jgi:hypothetical protein
MELFRYLMITREENVTLSEFKMSGLKKNSSFRIRDESVREVLIPNDRRPKDFWVRDREIFMIDTFCKFRTLAQVKYKFLDRHADLKNAKWFDYNFIKNRHDKILREVLRKIEMIIPR